jgi:chromosome segregation ATPase
LRRIKALASDRALYCMRWFTFRRTTMADASKREQFIESIKDKLDQLNGEIDRLEDKVRETSGEAEKKYQAQLEDVREKRAELKRKLTDIKAASEAQWDKMKLEVEHAWKAFHNSVNYFKSHFK